MILCRKLDYEKLVFTFNLQTDLKQNSMYKKERIYIHALNWLLCDYRSNKMSVDINNQTTSMYSAVFPPN